MELLHYWKILKKSLWLVILIVVAVVGLAVVLSLNEKPKYESSTQLLLNPTAGQKYAPTDNQLGAETLADSYTELLRSQSFGESVVKALAFTMRADSVAKAINTKLAVNTYFYKITADMESPQQSQQLLQAVIKVFLSTGDQDSSGDTVKADARKRLEAKLKDNNDQIKNLQTEII